jgi:hypothetical protein
MLEQAWCVHADLEVMDMWDADGWVSICEGIPPVLLKGTKPKFYL